MGVGKRQFATDERNHVRRIAAPGCSSLVRRIPDTVIHQSHDQRKLRTGPGLDVILDGLEGLKPAAQQCHRSDPHPMEFRLRL